MKNQLTYSFNSFRSSWYINYVCRVGALFSWIPFHKFCLRISTPQMDFMILDEPHKFLRYHQSLNFPRYQQSTITPISPSY